VLGVRGIVKVLDSARKGLVKERHSLATNVVFARIVYLVGQESKAVVDVDWGGEGQWLGVQQQRICVTAKEGEQYQLV